jgi:hypothetical protein
VAPPRISFQGERFVAFGDPLTMFVLAHCELVPARACCFVPWPSPQAPCECNQAPENKEGSSDRGGLRTVGRRPAAAGLLSPWSKQSTLIEGTEKRESYFGLYLEGGGDRSLRRNSADVEGLGL